MKNATRLFLCCAVLSMTFIACKKENQQAANGSIVGKWKLSANAFGTGGPMLWNKVAATDNHYVEFCKNGTLGGDAFTGYTMYAIKDSVNLFMKKNNDTTKYNYSYRIKHDTLTMSPTGPIICIEGCAVRFIKE